MNAISVRLIPIVIAIAMVSPATAHAGPKPHPLNEDAALELLLRTLKHDRVYEKRISLDCVTFGTEETTNAYFEFVLRENHSENCGGDPDVSPTVDRYRVYRTSRKIEWLDRINDNWRPYNPAKIR
jgi:hypothetical protein